MIVFLYGPDDYRRLQKKNELTGHFLKKHSALGLTAFDFEEAEEAEKFRAFVRSPSLFAPVRLAVVHHALEAGESIIPILKEAITSRELTLLLESAQKKIPKAFSFLTKEPVLSQEFATLSGPAWSAFVKAQLKRAGVSLAPEAAAFLAQVYEGDSWGLVTELEKLSLLAARALTLQDLKAFHLEITPDFWKLVNGLRAGDAPRRLAALEVALGQNEPAAKLFNILASLWQEKTARMAQLDLMVKSGKLDYEEALVDLAIS